MKRMILPRRALLKAGVAMLITSPAIIRSAEAQLSGGLMFPGPGTAHSAGGAFTPASISGLQGWYEADLGITGSSPVTGWADQSSNGRNLTQQAGAAAPSITAAGLNGKNIVTWPGATSSALVNSSYPLTGSLLSVFAVVRNRDASAGNNRAVVLAATGGSDTVSTSVIPIIYQSDTTENAFRGSYIVPQSVTVSVWDQIGVVFDGVNATPYKGGTAGSTAASSGAFSTVQSLYLGANPGGGNPLIGDIAALVITNTVMSGTEISNLKSYWTTKWAV